MTDNDNIVQLLIDFMYVIHKENMHIMKAFTPIDKQGEVEQFYNDLMQSCLDGFKERLSGV